MSYKSLGVNMTIPCTPPGRTIYETRSCREINKCTRECRPKKLKCEWCEEMNSRLDVLEEVETGVNISICSKCRETIKDKIIYGG
jgi:hypothetical protein